ncbi:hypothetical protein JB92DRAFT_2891327 [Gautieria morchelliformis]|nr:hypothetical protein JB92DRAFT_2891327 [Gautieria morchelliformis]
MPSFSSWFSKKSSDEDYEQVLASLALSIHKRQTQLSEIRLRERRATLLFTSWALAAWVAYVALWWSGVVGSRGPRRSSVLWGVPVVLGPVVILFTRRIVQLWYARKGNAEEKTLKKLLVEQRNKIEEIKKKTNYYSTKNLLDRYDESVTPGSKASVTSGLQSRGPPASVQPQLQPPSTPNGSTVSSQAPLSPQTPLRSGPQAGPQGQPFSPTLPPLPAPRKQWYDKLADALLGDDAASTGPLPTSRYALICERCFSHNGLVKEEQWEDAQYLCPKCGHFNRSARSRKVGLASPTSPQSVLSHSGLSTSHLMTPEPQSSQPAVPLSDSPSRRDPESLKSPLSESTVFVEKADAENKEGKVVGYNVREEENTQGKHPIPMDVDS